jgi:hypothetical protein
VIRQVIAYRNVSPDPSNAAELNRRPLLVDPRSRAARPERASEVPVDELNVVEAVVGDRLILHEYGPDEPLEIHVVEGGRAALLGSFEDAAAAWRALDDLDAPPRGA